MGLLEPSRELLLLIGDHLGQGHLNSLCRVNNFLYSALNGYLYRRNSWYDNSSALQWGVLYGYGNILQVAINNGADLQTRAAVPSCGMPKNLDDFSLNIQLELNSTYDMPTLLDRGLASTLALAAASGRVGLTSILLKHGALTNQDVYGETPLMLAAQGGHSEVVEILLRHGAEIMLANDMNALDIAASHGGVDVLGILLCYGADPNGTHCPPALISTIEGSHVDVVRMLLDWGADIYFKDTSGMTPYMYAKQTLNIALLELLLEPRNTGLDGADIEY